MGPHLDTPLALYVHIPFCRAKCRYCDFNSYEGLEELIPSYKEALRAEAAIWAGLCGRLRIATVYIGGGTPSLLSGDQVGQVLAAISASFELHPQPEITLEANPDSVSAELLSQLRSIGVNRLSLGIQSFAPYHLRTLGRLHSAGQAVSAFETARRAGFDNVNLDLMYGLPGQTLAGWRSDLMQALALSPEHLSLYSLTLEEDTPLGREVASGRVSLPESDLAADMYVAAEDILAGAGYKHYEISNWARPGHECRHNLAYWENRPYLGLGAGAHSCFEGCRFSNVTSPPEYIERLELGSPIALENRKYPSSVAQVESIEPRLEMAETVILGLRLVDGLDVESFNRRFGVRLEFLYSPQIHELAALGLLELTGSRLRLTRRGRLLGNEAFMRFLP